MTPRIGVWLVGARGSVATTTRVGAAAIAAGLAARTGMVTALDAFAGADLPEPDQLVFGGHDLAETSLRKRAELLADAAVIPHHLVDAVEDQLDAMEAEIRPGTTVAEPAAVAVDRLADDLREFARRNRLAAVVVVNVASTEAPSAGDDVPPSTRYAMAAVEAGCAYVNFTPSTGMDFPGLPERANASGICFAGKDGKTGETLVKTALAPMFADRNLHVRSWSGTNLLGGSDGATLADPERARAKLAAKGACLPDILGYTPAMPLHIDRVEDLGEWKTAWDHISFAGFLGVGMTMQFTWQGCDSALAAPLVLDLARLTGAAQLTGHRGLLAPLGFFFKDPAGGAGPGKHRLDRQFAELVSWARELGT
jgi:myo-inositol-1-phosphate synthase